MNWFNGSVAEAIRAVREESRFLLVFVKGSDESSEQMDKAFDSDISAVCANAVCLRLDASSEAAMQFSAVYVLLSVPCVYIIAPSGKAVDVKLGNIEKEELHQWIEKHIQTRPQASVSTVEVKSSTSGSPQREEAETIINSPESIPLEQRVDHAYKLLEEKRQERMEQEKEKSRAGEIKRRETGKSMQDFRERQRAREIEEAMAERRKDEAETRRLRERLRQQIEEDRRAIQERSRGANSQSATVPASGPSCSVTQTQQNRPSGEGDLARLQLRLVGGGYVIGRFSPTVTLAGDVRNWLQQSISVATQTQDGNGEYPNLDETTRQKLANLIAQGYRFRQLHPPKLFEPEEEMKSLVDAGLYPSAVLILVSSSNHTSIQPISGGWGSTVLGLVSGGVGTLYSYASWVLSSIYSFGTGFFSSLSPRHAAVPAASSTGASEHASPKLSGSKQSRAIRRQGNMARLSHLPDDSDDEQARWNGNSTEQL